MMLLTQVRRDHKYQTRAPLRTRVGYEVLVGVCVYWTLRDAVLSTYKMAAKTHCAMMFCQLRKWPHVRMPCRVYRPVRPLVLIYNSMAFLLFHHQFTSNMAT